MASTQSQDSFAITPGPQVGRVSGLRHHATLFGLAGSSNMCAAAITNPVNVVKVRMQLDGALSSTKERQYPGFFRSLVRIGKEEGVRGLWRGTGAALLREASYSSIRMSLYETFKNAWSEGVPAAHTPLWVKVLAGASAGTIGSAIANPTDVVMIRMQAPLMGNTVSGGRWQYRGPFEAFGAIARTEGLRGLYRGVGPTMQRAALLNAAQIPSYDHTKSWLLRAGLLREGVPCHLVASMTAGFVTAVVMAPIDLIKTRIMQQAVRAGGGDGVLYSSTLDCFWKTLRAEGPWVFTRDLFQCGCGSAPTRSSPSSSTSNFAKRSASDPFEHSRAGRKFKRSYIKHWGIA